MSTTTKSPLAVARRALQAGTDALRPYSHRFSPKTKAVKEERAKLEKQGMSAKPVTISPAPNFRSFLV